MFGQMPGRKKHASAAEKQSAYRRRRKDRIPETEPARAVQPVVPSTPGYGRWRSMRARALLILERVASEMETYHEERSESWRESDRAEAFLEVMESFAEIAADLRDLQPL